MFRTEDVSVEIKQGGETFKHEAYGTGDSADLAAAEWNGKPAKAAAKNADNFAFIAAGTSYDPKSLQMENFWGAHIVTTRSSLCCDGIDTLFAVH